MRSIRRILSCLLLVCLLFTCVCAEAATIHMTFTGDVTLGSEVKKRNQPTSFHSVAAAEGYDYFLKNWVEMFSNDDVTVINLEGPLTDSDKGEDKSKTYRFNGLTEFTKILQAASIEGANISNNHTAADFGKQGWQSTKDALDAAGIGWFAVQTYWVWTNGTVKIAFFGMNSTKFNNNKETMANQISMLKSAEGVNAVVFVFHGGTEYGKVRNRTQENAAHYAIDAGADLVIMHHPHVVQGMEVYNNRTICYSLGNFCFGGNKDIRELDAVVAGVTFDFDDQGVYTGQQITLYPAHISGHEKYNDYQPVRVSGEAAASVIRKMQRDTTQFTYPEPAEDGSVVLPYVPAAEAEQGEAN